MSIEREAKPPKGDSSRPESSTTAYTTADVIQEKAAEHLPQGTDSPGLSASSVWGAMTVAGAITAINSATDAVGREINRAVANLPELDVTGMMGRAVGIAGKETLLKANTLDPTALDSASDFQNLMQIVAQGGQDFAEDVIRAVPDDPDVMINRYPRDAYFSGSIEALKRGENALVSGRVDGQSGVVNFRGRGVVKEFTTITEDGMRTL